MLGPFLSLDNQQGSVCADSAEHAPRHNESFPGQPCAKRGRDEGQPTSATHSISQPLPNRSCIDQAVRAGGSTGKNSRYTRSISAICEISARTTCTRTTRSSDDPADSNICCMLESVVRICSAIGP